MLYSNYLAAAVQNGSTPFASQQETRTGTRDYEVLLLILYCLLPGVRDVVVTCRPSSFSRRSKSYDHTINYFRSRTIITLHAPSGRLRRVQTSGALALEAHERTINRRRDRPQPATSLNVTHTSNKQLLRKTDTKDTKAHI